MGTEALEAAVAKRVGARHVVAVKDPASALRLAMGVLGLAPGKALWTSPIGPTGIADAARALGATVDYIDVDARTANLSALALAERLVAAEYTGEMPGALAATAFAGHPVELRALHDLANRYGFYLLEDATEALGATYEDTAVGGSRFADLTVLGVGGVGVVTMSRSEWAARLRAEREAPGEAEVAGALAALATLDMDLARRAALAAHYDEALAGLPVERPWRSPDHLSALTAYWLQLPDTATRDAVAGALRAAGVEPGLPAATPDEAPPQATAFAARAIAVPVRETLSDADLDRVTAALEPVLRR